MILMHHIYCTQKQMRNIYFNILGQSMQTIYEIKKSDTKKHFKSFFHGSANNLFFNHLIEMDQ